MTSDINDSQDYSLTAEPDENTTGDRMPGDGEYDGESTETIPQDGSSLPQALKDLRFKQYLAAAGIFLLTLGFTIAARNLRILFVSFLSVWFAYNGFSIERDYRSGKIAEVALICTSVRKSSLSDSFSVGFRTADEYPALYQFKLNGRKHADEFVPNGVYLIYFNVGAPSQLLAYTPV